jgi:hypothetical protein
MVQIHRSQLTAAEYNPRLITEDARARLKRGIKNVGLVQPPVWNRTTGRIVGGHQRVSILDTLYGTEDYMLNVAAIEVDEIKEKEINLLLNNQDAMGEFDLDKLEDMFKTEGLNLDSTGFDSSDIFQMFGEGAANVATDIFDDAVEKMREVSSGFQGSSNTGVENDGFFCVMVFVSDIERDEFLAAIGLPETRYIDGRKFARFVLSAKEKGATFNA